MEIVPEDLCRTCLSIGRKLWPLQEYLQIYFNLLTDSNHEVKFRTAPILVCWECRKLFYNMSNFKKQVQEAEELINLGQHVINGPLSRLSSVVLNDAHVQNVIHDYEDIILSNSKEIKDEIYEDMKDVIDNSNFFDDDLSNEYEMKLKDEGILTFNKVEYLSNIPGQQETVEKVKKKKISKCVVKRSKEKKKEQFRIISPNNIKLEKLYKFFSVTPEEVCVSLNKDRDREDYKLQKYKCENCAVSLETRASLFKHRKMKHKESNKYTCDMCKQKLFDKDKLTEHIKQHCMKYSCNTCAFISNDKKYIIKHYKKVFKCLKCQKKFCSKSVFNEHNKRWHEQYICGTCGMEFKKKYRLEKHFRTKHGPFVCSKCSKEFETYKDSRNHYRVDHGGSPEAVYCVECDLYFVNHYRYKMHLANTVRHKTDENHRFPCKSCDRVYKSKIYLRNHVNFVHLQKFNFRCEKCDKKYLKKSSLNDHLLRRHQGVLPPKNKICYLCGRGFNTNRILTHHMRTHTGERPHICSHCPAAFAQEVALRSHVRAVHCFKTGS